MRVGNAAMVVGSEHNHLEINTILLYTREVMAKILLIEDDPGRLVPFPGKRFEADRDLPMIEHQIVQKRQRKVFPGLSLAFLNENIRRRRGLEIARDLPVNARTFPGYDKPEARRRLPQRILVKIKNRHGKRGDILRFRLGWQEFRSKGRRRAQDKGY